MRPLTYDIGGLKYVVPAECNVKALTMNGKATSTPGKALIDPTDGAAYKTPAGKEFQLWGGIAMAVGDDSGSQISFIQSDASDAATNSVLIWKQFLGEFKFLGGHWIPFTTDTKVAAEKYILEFSSAGGKTGFNTLIGCEMPE